MNLRCATHDCQALPSVRVYWPGQVPAPVFCVDCAIRAVRTAEAMGFKVANELLPRDELITLMLERAALGEDHR